MPAAVVEAADAVEARLPGVVQATFWPAGRVPADGHVALWGTRDPERDAAEIGLPAGEAATMGVALPASPRARTRTALADVPARVVPVLAAARALAALPAGERWPAWKRPSDAVLAWSVAAKLALETVAAGRLVPDLQPAGEQLAVARWRAVPPADGRLARLAEALPPAAHALAADECDDAVWSPSALLAAFLDAVADACGRAAPRPAAPAGRRPWEAQLAAALTGGDPLVAVDGPEGAAAALADRIAGWAAPLGRRDGRATARLCVQLHTPDGADDEEGADVWRLTYWLQAADDPSLVVPADQVWDSSDGTLELLGRRIGDPQESLVGGLAEAARVFAPIDASLSEAKPAQLTLDAGQAAAFVSEAAGALAAAGLGVWLPAELTAHGARRLRARLRVGAPGPTDPGAGITGAGLDADGIAEFRWEAAIATSRSPRRSSTRSSR